MMKKGIIIAVVIFAYALIYYLNGPVVLINYDQQSSVDSTSNIKEFFEENRVKKNIILYSLDDRINLIKEVPWPAYSIEDPKVIKNICDTLIFISHQGDVPGVTSRIIIIDDKMAIREFFLLPGNSRLTTDALQSGISGFVTCNISFYYTYKSNLKPMLLPIVF